jgi:hypothetical protein
MDPSSIGGPTLMDIDEPVKTINGETAREATYPITLHISASLDNSNGVNAFIDAFNA